MVLGVATLCGVAALLVWDLVPDRFPARAHDWIAALPLGAIAIVWLAHRASERPAPAALLKASILAVAFLFWAANQLWPDSVHATFWNDVAIALFVLDVWLAIRERTQRAPSVEGDR